ncbi:hypothetical protein PR048_024565 [Dryococelus australis]|uniref:Uncharacterized protein n=1 Tax=Dryococelus australis TaxID=614101 RepID=A0ABQ9GNX5_9NEOP|nr:hypothetical protein PR048_024565 [Dryococelus australis]
MAKRFLRRGHARMNCTKLCESTFPFIGYCKLRRRLHIGRFTGRRVRYQATHWQTAFKHSAGEWRHFTGACTCNSLYDWLLSPQYPYALVAERLDSQSASNSTNWKCLGYCVWGWTNDIVYQRTAQTREQLLARIMQAATEIKDSRVQLRGETRAVHKRAAKCMEVDRNIFEHLLQACFVMLECKQYGLVIHHLYLQGYGAAPECRGNGRTPEKTRRPAASLELNPVRLGGGGVASPLATEPPRPHDFLKRSTGVPILFLNCSAHWSEPATGGMFLSTGIQPYFSSVANCCSHSSWTYTRTKQTEKDVNELGMTDLQNRQTVRHILEKARGFQEKPLRKGTLCTEERKELHRDKMIAQKSRIIGICSAVVLFLLQVNHADYCLACQDHSDMWERGILPPERLPQSTVSHLLEKFKITGSVADAPRSGRPSTSTEAEETILAKVLGVPRTTLQRILKKDELHPYKLHLMHHVTEDNPDRRVEMCSWFLELVEEYEDFLSKVNRQNMRYWSNTNPHWLTNDKNKELLASWFGVVCGKTKYSALTFFEVTVNSENYLVMLGNLLMPDLHIIDSQRQWFMQDGAPPHYGTQVRHWLDENLPQWIGGRGTVEWAPRSPDLNPMDFAVWGYLKSKVISVKIRDNNHLHERIAPECSAITPILALLQPGEVQQIVVESTPQLKEAHVDSCGPIPSTIYRCRILGANGPPNYIPKIFLETVLNNLGRWHGALSCWHIP